MFLKKSLAVGLVAALGTSTALATFDLDSKTETGVTFALETLDGAAATTVGAVVTPNVTNAGSALDVVALIGIGVANTEDVFIRYNITNGVFGAAPTLVVPTSTSSIVQGGTVASSFVIFQVAATGTIAQTAVTTMAAALYASTSSASATTVSMTVYETLTQATSQGAALVTKTAATGASMINYASGLKATIKAATTGNVADVELGFAGFTGAIAANLANIGSATVTASATALDAGDGAAVALGDMITDTTSKATISGDFSIATQSLGLSATAGTCATQTALVANTAKTAAAAVTVAALNATSVLCYNVGATNKTTAIPKGSYTVAVAFVGNSATAVSPTASASGTIGTVAHNGTTVQLPYLTTFSDYNQRLVMVNRGATTASYTVSAFQTEAGTTAAAGTGATGTIPAGGSAMVKVSDVVTLTGGTRAAGTVDIVAAAGNISVATTQVNLSDGGTDTVTLQ